MAVQGSCAVLLVLVPLLLILGTFPHQEFDDAPDQAYSRFTGYPVWHPEITSDHDDQKTDASLLFTLFILCITTVLSIYWTTIYETQIRNTLTYFHDGHTVAPATIFNALISFYSLSALISLASTYFFDISKLFVAVGVFHNAIELALILLIQMSGRVASYWYFITIVGYTLVVVLMSVYVEWPTDAVIFGIQGLTLKWILLLAIIRLYIHTRKHYEEDGQGRLPLILETGPELISPQEPLFPNTVDHPMQIWLLIIATALQLFGMSLGIAYPADPIIFDTMIWTYCISFLLYCFYVYLETHAYSEDGQKRYYQPHSPTWKVTIIVLWSLFFVFFSLRILVLFR